MKRRLVLLAAAGLVLAGCKAESPSSAPKTVSGETPGPVLRGKLVITGSSTVAPLMAEIGKRFEAKHPGVRVDVQTGGSSRGINDARQGLAHIGMASRSLKANESDLTGWPVAKDGIAVIVHAGNPVKELSKDQVIGIYTGKIANWKEVGGKDAPITVVNKAEGRSTLELFVGHFGLKNEEIKASVVIGDNAQGIKTVAGNPDSIGYVSVGTAEYDAKSGAPIKLLPMDGVAASTESVRDGKFALSRTLNLVTKGEQTGLSRAFLEFAQSAEVQDVVKEQYFVPMATTGT